MSCDLEPSERPGPHYQGDVFDLDLSAFDLIIAHPPCTFLCSSGLHWNTRRPDRAVQTEQALQFVLRLWSAPVARLALENPQGCINTRLPEMPVPQYVQPYDFGEDASKKTGLWLRGLPPLKKGRRVPGRIVRHNGRDVERWGNQTDSGQNKLAPSADRWRDRSRTFQGIADAMASQWGAL